MSQIMYIISPYILDRRKTLMKTNEIAKKNNPTLSYPTQPPKMYIYDRSKYKWSEIQMDCYI